MRAGPCRRRRWLLLLLRCCLSQLAEQAAARLLLLPRLLVLLAGLLGGGARQRWQRALCRQEGLQAEAALHVHPRVQLLAHGRLLLRVPRHLQRRAWV